MENLKPCPFCGGAAHMITRPKIGVVSGDDGFLSTIKCLGGGDWNKNSLTKEQQNAVETCARYVIYTLFETRERFENWCKEEK